MLGRIVIIKTPSLVQTTCPPRFWILVSQTSALRPKLPRNIAQTKLIKSIAEKHTHVYIYIYMTSNIPTLQIMHLRGGTPGSLTVVCGVGHSRECHGSLWVGHPRNSHSSLWGWAFTGSLPHTEGGEICMYICSFYLTRQSCRPEPCIHLAKLPNQASVIVAANFSHTVMFCSGSNSEGYRGFKNIHWWFKSFQVSDT